MKTLVLKSSAILGGFRSLVAPAVAVALTLVAVLVGPDAFAQYTAGTPAPVALFDFAALVTAVLVIAGAALTAVAGFKITMGIGRMVMRYFVPGR